MIIWLIFFLFLPNQTKFLPSAFLVPARLFCHSCFKIHFFPPFPIRVSEKPVCIYLFWQVQFLQFMSYCLCTLSRIYCTCSYTHMYVISCLIKRLQLYTCFLTLRRSKQTSSKFISIFIIQVLHNITTLPFIKNISDDSFLSRPNSVLFLML